MDPACEICRQKYEDTDERQIGPSRDEVEDRVEMQTEPLV